MKSKDEGLFKDLEFILKEVDISTLRISSFTIYRPEKARDKRDNSFRNVIKIFNNMVLNYRQLPKDDSLSRVIYVLGKLDRADDAETLFDCICMNVDPRIQKQVVNAYSYAAILQILYRRLKKSEMVDEKLISKFSKLWNECIEKKFDNDPYILINIMGFYSCIGKYAKSIEIFKTYERYSDLPMHGRYVLALIKMGKLDEALQELGKIIQKYKELKNKKRSDSDSIYAIYNNLIINAVAHQSEGEEQALKIFGDALKQGFYSNNKLQVFEKECRVKLDFHINKDYKKVEGGLPLAVAKVAFLYFMRQVAKEEIHFSAIVVTGGHQEGQTKLKEEFPNYLQKEYGVEVIWDSACLQFIIPYRDIRKIRFMQDMCIYLDSQTEHFDIKRVLNGLKRNFRADLRRDNESRSDKYFSDKPIIPIEFDQASREFAEDTLLSFSNRDYRESERLCRKLIDENPSHPWPYIHLGWVLHRVNQFDAAIQEYQKGIAILTNEKYTDSALLSDAYRKIGWSYDRKHRASNSNFDLKQALSYYEKAIQSNKNNCETYNNWGITLKRIEKFDEAIVKFLHVMQEKPEHDEACVHLGDCYKSMGNYGQSLKFYQEAIKRSEQYDGGKSASWAYSELGDLYYIQYKNNPNNENLFLLSRDAFEKSLKLQSTRDQSYKGLALLYTLKGDKSKAEEYLTEARKKCPNYPENFKPTRQEKDCNNNNDNVQQNKTKTMKEREELSTSIPTVNTGKSDDVYKPTAPSFFTVAKKLGRTSGQTETSFKSMENSELATSNQKTKNEDSKVTDLMMGQ